MGMAMFYVLFLLTVMKFFEGSDGFPIRLATTSPVESLVAVDREILSDIGPVVERQMSSHVVRVLYPPHHPSQDLGHRPLLSGESDKDDSKISDIIDSIRASGSCDGDDDGGEVSNRCRRLFPTKIRPRLREPMLRRNGLLIRSLFGLARRATRSNKRALLNHGAIIPREWRRRQPNENSGSYYILNSEWGASRIR